MKIGIISDSHDRLPALKNAVTMLNQMDLAAVLHAGDHVAPFAAKCLVPSVLKHPLHCIYGNNDGERRGLASVLPQICDGPLPLKIGGRRIVMAHFIDWLSSEDIGGAEIVITGHTHSIVNEKKDGRLFLNPGECCGWLTGRCTIAVVDLEKIEAQILDVKPD